MVKAAIFGPVKLRPAGNAAPEREDLKRADEHDGNAEDGQDGSRDIAGLLHCEAANNCLGQARKDDRHQRAVKRTYHLAVDGIGYRSWPRTHSLQKHGIPHSARP